MSRYKMNEVVVQFHPKLQPFIRTVLKEKVGIRSGNMKVIDVLSGAPTNSSHGNGDRFKLSIPYAGQKIVWHVVFNHQRPQFAPDFCFDDESFLADPEIPFLEENVPSLVSWNSRDPKALLNVIAELLALYRKHQVSLLEHLDYSRLQFEYSSLVCQAQVHEDDVEVLVGSGRAHAIHFLIRLQVNFDGLPPMATEDHVSEAAAVLIVTFHSPEASRISPQLLLSPRVESALDGGLQLPPFPPGGSCLMDYVPVVTAQLQDRVANAIASFEKKKELFSCLLHHYGKSVLEYDRITFDKLSLLLEWRDFYFLLHITLHNFPREKPVLTFQSVYHATYGKPYRSRCEDYSYNSRWDAARMVESLVEATEEYVESFQRNSIQSSQG